METADYLILLHWIGAVNWWFAIYLDFLWKVDDDADNGLFKALSAQAMPYSITKEISHPSSEMSLEFNPITPSLCIYPGWCHSHHSLNTVKSFQGICAEDLFSRPWSILLPNICLQLNATGLIYCKHCQLSHRLTVRSDSFPPVLHFKPFIMWYQLIF